jgi:LPS O-antigen subunit length determinant protein (WzzB/FepE family)
MLSGLLTTNETKKIDQLFTEEYKFSIVTNSRGEILYSEFVHQFDSQQESKIQELLQDYLTKKIEVNPNITLTKASKYLLQEDKFQIFIACLLFCK